MRIVHKGFDTIALSIQANISQAVFEQLNEAKELAEQARSPMPVTINGMDFDLLPYGGQGYRFLLKAGIFDAQWSIKKPNPRDPWGIRINIGSTFLATQGLGRARAQIDRTLARLGIRYTSEQVSLSRADFCVDILAPNFVLNPDCFVTHSHTNRSDYHAMADDIRSNGKSGRFTSVTVGKMPGRQVILYDKRQQVIDTKKPIWWDIWNTNLTREGLPPLDRSDPTRSRVWRLEVRGGKDLLKDRWQIRTWGQFDALFGDLVAEALERVRYCVPDFADTNRARWPNHPFWDIAASAFEDDLQEMRSYLPPDQIKSVHRAEHIRLIEAQVLGGALTLGALEGTDDGYLADYMHAIGPRLAKSVQDDFPKAANKLEEAKLRYRFI